SAWPGDLIAGGFLTPGAGALVPYANILLSKGYLKGGDVIKLFNAPSAVFTAGVQIGPPEKLINPAGTASLKVYPCLDADPANAIFAVTHNYVYDTLLAAGGVPYASKASSRSRKAAMRPSSDQARTRKPVGVVLTLPFRTKSALRPETPKVP